MTITNSILRPGAYTKVWEVLNVLTKPHVLILLTHIEANPNCSTSKLHLCAGLPNTNRSRISQVLKEMKDVGIITIDEDPSNARMHRLNLNAERVNHINNSVARML